MKLLAFILCDQIIARENNTLDIIGATNWETKMPELGTDFRISAFISFLAEPNDTKKHQLKLYFKNPDGQDFGPPAENNFVPKQGKVNIFPIKMMSVQLIYPGRYGFHLFLNNKLIAVHPFDVYA